MKKLSFSAIVVALCVFVYAQEKKNPVMEVSKEVPKAMSKKEAGQVSDEEWKKRLTPQQYVILRKSGTEYSNGRVYKEFKKQGEGAYLCVGCDNELFSSKEKFDSRSGWPSFYDPSQSENVKSVIESDGSGRVEVRCATCDGHLGHVFKGEGYDTPSDKRYCINGTVLKFVPVEVMEAGEKEKVSE